MLVGGESGNLKEGVHAYIFRQEPLLQYPATPLPATINPSIPYLTFEAGVVPTTSLDRSPSIVERTDS